MKVADIKESNGAVSVNNHVIVPMLSSAATCDIPACQSCELSRAKQRKAPVVKAKVNESSEGAISRDQYQPGDFVSIDQYVVKTPGRLPTGFGQESEQNMYHGGTIFRDAASKYIHVSNQVSLGAGELFFQREILRIGFGRRHVCALNTIAVIMECLQLNCSRMHVRRMIKHRALVV